MWTNRGVSTFDIFDLFCWEAKNLAVLEPIKNENATNTKILKQHFFFHFYLIKRTNQMESFFKQNIIIIIIIILQTTETYVPHLFSNNLDNVYKFKLIFEKKKKKNFLLLTIFFFSNIFSWHFWHLYLYFISFQMNNSAQSKDLKIQSKNSFLFLKKFN